MSICITTGLLHCTYLKLNLCKEGINKLMFSPYPNKNKIVGQYNLFFRYAILQNRYRLTNEIVANIINTHRLIVKLI